jgi:hypothetical protein
VRVELRCRLSRSRSPRVARRSDSKVRCYGALCRGTLDDFKVKGTKTPGLQKEKSGC